MSDAKAALLEKLLAPLRDDLVRVEAEITRMTTSESEPLEHLFRHLARFSGKRLRPAMTVRDAWKPVSMRARIPQRKGPRRGLLMST